MMASNFPVFIYLIHVIVRVYSADCIDDDVAPASFER